MTNNSELAAVYEAIRAQQIANSGQRTEDQRPAAQTIQICPLDYGLLDDPNYAQQVADAHRQHEVRRNSRSL